MYSTCGVTPRYCLTCRVTTRYCLTPSSHLLLPAPLIPPATACPPHPTRYCLTPSSHPLLPSVV